MILLATLAAALATAAVDVDETQFRYARTLSAPSGVAVRFEPDKPLYGHAGIDFPDLRILDSEGEQVPWRAEPKPAAVPSQVVGLVARGRLNGVVTVVVDRGAVAARSTTAVFPPTDYRFLLVHARGVSDITGAAVARDPSQPQLKPVQARSTTRQRQSTTVIRLDLGFARVPVDRLSIRSSTPRYVRGVAVEGSNDGTTFISLSDGEIARFPGVDLSTIALAARHRFLRVTIRNGDDTPLEGLRVMAEAMPRPLLVASGSKPPFRLLYGATRAAAPSYDFARLPAAATGFETARQGSLGTERANELFEPPGDTRTFFERNDYLIEILLVLVTIVVAAAGLLALRRRTSASES